MRGRRASDRPTHTLPIAPFVAGRIREENRACLPVYTTHSEDSYGGNWDLLLIPPLLSNKVDCSNTDGSMPEGRRLASLIVPAAKDPKAQRLNVADGN